jgi:hypothetical protein
MLAQHTNENKLDEVQSEVCSENIQDSKLLLIQPKLSVGTVNDPFEYEADAMADRVMRMPESSFVQRKCASCEHEEEKVSRKTEPFIQKQDNGLEGGTASESVTNQINSSRGGGSKMSENTLSFMESRFNTGFSGVKIHTDSNAVQMSRELNAQAFTVGNDIYFNEGKYSPESASGKHLLAHELTHTVQQGGGIDRKIQRVIELPTTCPSYDTGEVTESHSSSGILTDDVILLNDGQLLIADFGVDSSTLKRSIRGNTFLRTWLDAFERDDSYRLTIKGYSDCVGSEANNSDLRQNRASNVESLLGTSARSRVSSVGSGFIYNYPLSNTSKTNRAKNRGVIIEFSQEFDFEGDTITVEVNKCGPDVGQWLVNQMSANQNHPVILTARENEWPRYIPIFNLGWTYGFLSDFRELVRAGGVWDYKSQQGRRGGPWRMMSGRECPSEPCDRTITMCGTCYNYDVPGNINYGYVGVAAGLRPWFLHNRADAAQAGGVDDPRDSIAIDIGIRMYRDGTSLCDELRTHHDELNLDRTNNCVPCG